MTRPTDHRVPGGHGIRRAALGVVVAVSVSAWAVLPCAGQSFPYVFRSGLLNEGLVPDGDLSGWGDTRTLAGSGLIESVVVTIELNNGFNGDLYAYVSHGGVLVPLLNRVGVTASDGIGYDDAGMNVSFADGSALGDIHWYQTVVGFTTKITDGSAWQPDGRTLAPTTEPSSEFDSASRTTLNAFQGLAMSGDWTLFVSDVVGGGGSTQVVGWGLQITAVPEPWGSWVAGAVGCGGVAAGIRWRKVRASSRS